MIKGWAKRWRANGYIRKNNKVPNADLCGRMLKICVRHKLVFRWVKGHDSIAGNERCDQLEESVAWMPDLPINEGYIHANDQ